MKFPLLRATTLAACVASTLLGTGCDSDNGSSGSPGGGTGSTTTTMTVTPSLGRVSNAMVEVICSTTNLSMGSAALDGAGVATVTVSGNCAGPLIADLYATTSSQYYDEGAAALVNFPAATDVRALVTAFIPGVAMHVAVTPLTEIAYQRAVAQAGGVTALTAAQANAANLAIPALIFGAGVIPESVRVVPSTWDATTTTLGSSAEDRYAFLLGTFAAMAGTTGTPAITALEAFAGDLVDGTLDGGSNGSFSYTSGGLAAARTAAMGSLASYADASLKTALSIPDNSTPLTLTGFSPTSGAVGTTVTLTGTGFSPTLASNIVRFTGSTGTGIPATVVSGSTTQLTVTVPAGAQNGPLTVYDGNSVTSSAGSFTVTAAGAAITGISQTSIWATGNLARLHVAADGTNLMSVTQARIGSVVFPSNKIKRVFADDFSTREIAIVMNGSAASGIVELLDASANVVAASAQTVTITPAPLDTAGIALVPDPAGGCGDLNPARPTGTLENNCTAAVLPDFTANFVAGVGRACQITKSGAVISLYIDGAASPSVSATLNGGFGQAWSTQGSGYEALSLLSFVLRFHNNRLYQVETNYPLDSTGTALSAVCTGAQ